MAEADGVHRVKFSAVRDGEISKQKGREDFKALASRLAETLVDLERIGAAPALEGGVAGNCAAIVNDELLLVSRSGKTAGVRCAWGDFVAVTDFDTKAWSCHYLAASASEEHNIVDNGDVVPTSDTPIHFHALRVAPYKYSWSVKPKIALHGHGLSTAEKAKELNLPCSKKATLFSTPEDVKALDELFAEFPYPENKIFVRMGHGFLLLGETVEECEQLLKNLATHF